jgi:opacity protein-like surface antigen
MTTMSKRQRLTGDSRLAYANSALSSAVTAALLLLSAPAWAQEEAPPTPSEARAPATPATPEPEAQSAPTGPHTANSLQIGLGFRYGALLSDGEPNPWGTGLGLSVGYTLPVAIYVGGNFEYFFGASSDDVPGLKVSSNIWQLSAEGGYDIGLGENFVIRPKIGLGIANAKSKIEGCGITDYCSGDSASSSDTKPLVAPGATFMLFTRHVSLSFDARYAIVLADPSAKALIFSAGIGF